MTAPYAKPTPYTVYRMTVPAREAFFGSGCRVLPTMDRSLWLLDGSAEPSKPVADVVLAGNQHALRLVSEDPYPTERADVGPGTAEFVLAAVRQELGKNGRRQIPVMDVVPLLDRIGVCGNSGDPEDFERCLRHPDRDNAGTVGTVLEKHGTGRRCTLEFQRAADMHLYMPCIIVSFVPVWAGKLDLVFARESSKLTVQVKV
jgi:hypothetical protein